MQDAISGLQPSVFALIGIGTLIFVSHPKQVKKWQEEPPTPLKLTPLRMLKSTLFVLAYASVFSIIFSPDAKYALINFVIICVMNVIYLTVVTLEIKKYSKLSDKTQ